MKRSNWLFTGAALGAGLMYFADPARGKQRRALLDEQLRLMLNLPQRPANVDAANEVANEALQPRNITSDPDVGNDRPTSAKPESALDRPWAPATRMVVGTLGAGLALNFLRRMTPGSLLFGVLGAGMIRKSAERSGDCMQKIEAAVSAASSPVTVQDEIEIKAPLDRVYRFFSNPENYLRISESVTNVEILGGGRFTKDMRIAGVPVHFAEQFVRQEENQLLESVTVEGSALTYHKTMWFEDYEDGSTRVHLVFVYQPPGGAIGDSIGKLAGIDAKSILDELLKQAKAYIEADKAISGGVSPSSEFAIGSVGAAVARDKSDDADDDGREPGEEQIVSPDYLDQAFSSKRERIHSDDRNSISPGESPQTNSDGENFMEDIATSVTESPTPDELRAADSDPDSLEAHPDGGVPQRKPR